jgi:hypothetical protein
MATTLAGVLREMLAASNNQDDRSGGGGGVGNVFQLWSGLGPLVLRELLFSLPKFLVFNSASTALAASLPLLPFFPPSLAPSFPDTVGASLGVSFCLMSFLMRRIFLKIICLLNFMVADAALYLE